MVVQRLPRSGVVRVPLANGATLRLWSRGDDWISTQLFWRGMAGYEPETVRPFFALARRAAVTVDVGAYVGYMTVLAGLANPVGRVIALEPMPGSYERLRRNVALNGLENVECLRAAAGRRPGTGQLVHPQVALPSAASLHPGHFGSAWDACDLVNTPVEVVTLDDLVERQGIARVDLLKLDTEQTEVDVLAGAAGILRRDRPDVFCEILATKHGTRIEQLVDGLGYHFYELLPEGPQERERIVTRGWTNYLLSTTASAEITQLPA